MTPGPDQAPPGRPDRARDALIERLFFEAADLRQDERRRFLDAHCAGDQSLRHEVERLLSIDRKGTAGPLANTPVAPSDLPMAISRSVIEAESLPRWIGPYRAVRRLGEGGFGLVYLAEQNQPIRRNVALKVLRPGMGSPQVLERFMAERQALALMDHPGVARVFDAGATPDGSPYFAMEFVDGLPITEHVRRHALPLTARIELLIQVCDAVHHAHQKGVIHRDIKPSNILVEESPRETTGLGTHGRPKVIDFGIAKAMAEPLTGHTLHTLSGQLIGTPEYMSPEQAASAADVDTRGDVYSLGVVLYELLTGMLPFDPLRLRTCGPADIQRIIRDEAPPRPSDRLARAADEAESAGSGAVAAALGIDPRDTVRRIRGELDWIVGRAIEKDRQRRYVSAHDLGLDLRRHLCGDPVLAGPPSRRYRLAKWAGRHTTLLATGAAVSLAVLAGLTGTALGLRAALREGERARDAERLARVEAQNAREAQRLAGLEAERARTHAITAQRTSDFLSRMLRGVGPVVAQGADTTILRQILDKAAADVGTDLADEPLAEARLRHSIGSAFQAIQRSRDGQAHLERAVALFRSLPDASTNELSLAMTNLAASYHAQDRLDEAAALYESVLELELGPLDAPGLAADTLAKLALVRFDQGELDTVMEIASRSMMLFEEHGDPESDEAVLLRNTVAMTASRQGDSQRALDLYRESLEISERRVGRDHPTTVTTRANVASTLSHLGRRQEALPFLAECVEDMRRIYGPAHSETITTMSNYAAALLHLGRLDEAAPIFQDAARLAAENLGDTHWITQYTRINLGTLAQSQGRFDDAASHFGGAVSVLEQRTGPHDPEVRRFRNRLSDALRLAGRAEEAAAEARRSAEAVQRPDAAVLLALRYLALAELDLSNAPEAIDASDRLDEAARAIGGTSGRDARAWAADLRGRAAQIDGRPGDAAESFQAAYHLWVEGYGPGDSDARRIAAALSDLFVMLERDADAALWRERARPPTPPAPP